MPVATGLLVLTLSLAVAFLTVNSPNQKNLASSQRLQTEADVSGATLALSPATGDYTFSPNTTYPLGIVLDSADKNVDGVDVVINFDPNKVRIVTTAVTTTTLFEEFPQNKVDNLRGQIKFSALTFTPKPTTGIVGTFSLKPLVKGEINLTFAFTPGATTDSNVAEHATAKDVLVKVANARYNFR